MSKFIGVVVIVIFIFCAICCWIPGCLEKVEGKQKKEIQQNEKTIQEQQQNITDLKEQTDILDLYLEKNEDEVTVYYSYPNTSSNSEKKLTLKGKSVYVDFWSLKLSTGYVAIPYRMYTEKMKPSEGILILSDYIFSDAYSGVTFSPVDKATFTDCISQIRKSPAVQPYPDLTEGHAFRTDTFDIEYVFSIHKTSPAVERRIK